MASFASSSRRRGQPHTVIENAGHVLQEDQGERLAALVVDFIAG
jgi:haloalkane dehalogenase